MHWIDKFVEELILLKKKKIIISAGISPTGEAHIGSIREAITSGIVTKVLKKKHENANMVYCIDSFDPLRKCYNFLPKEFNKFIGVPINLIECPCGNHKSYAEHFFEPFKEILDRLNIDCKILWTHEQYENGRFGKIIDLVFNNRLRIIEILRGVTGRSLPNNFPLFNSLCEKCKRFAKPNDETYNYPYVEYVCEYCGYEDKSNIEKGQVKMLWRVEWPAKWKEYEVDLEPFGKDHAAAGGSYDSGKRIVEEIFEKKVPIPIPYEFVKIKGKGEIHKSTGGGVTGLDAIKICSPRIIKYIFLKTPFSRHITFDPGVGVINLFNEYEKVEEMYKKEKRCIKKEGEEIIDNNLRTYEIIGCYKDMKRNNSYKIPFEHVANIIQITNIQKKQFEIILRSIGEENIKKLDLEDFEMKKDCAKYWIDVGFAPESKKFLLCEENFCLNKEEKNFIEEIYECFKKIEWVGKKIHEMITEVSNKYFSGPRGFLVLYKIFINRDSGPKIGYFFELLGLSFVLDRLKKIKKSWLENLKWV